MAELVPVRIFAREKYLLKKDAKRGKYRARTGPRCCSSNCPAKARTKDWLIRRRPVAQSSTVVRRSALMRVKK